MSFLGIKDIDIIYKICKINSYLTSLYEDNSLWLLRISRIYVDLHILERVKDAREVYFDIRTFTKNPYTKDDGSQYYLQIADNIDELLEYSIKSNYLSILEWIISTLNNKEYLNILFKIVSKAIHYNNLVIIKYIIENYGVSEEELHKYNFTS